MYTATFKLVQDEEGMVTPSVQFDPKVDPTTTDAPPIYEYMSHVAMNFLREVNLVDEDNNWTNDEAAERVELDLSQRKRLN